MLDTTRPVDCTLPAVAPHRLRAELVAGLQTRDREVRVFAAKGFSDLHPYGFVAKEILDIPTSVVAAPGSKGELLRVLAGDLLPAAAFKRAKMRAQIGDPEVVRGTLPLLLRCGLEEVFIERFCDAVALPNPRTMQPFMAGGRYRQLRAFPTKSSGHGSFAQ